MARGKGRPVADHSTDVQAQSHEKVQEHGGDQERTEPQETELVLPKGSVAVPSKDDDEAPKPRPSATVHASANNAPAKKSASPSLPVLGAVAAALLLAAFLVFRPLLFDHDAPQEPAAKPQATTPEVEPEPEPEPLDISRAAYKPTIEGYLQSGAPSLIDEPNPSYVIEDINGDGICELLIGSEAANSVYGIWTLEGGNVKQLAEGWPRSSYSVLEDGRLLYHGSGGIANGTYVVYRIQDAQLVEDVRYEYRSDDNVNVTYTYSNVREGIEGQEVDDQFWEEYSQSLVERQDLTWQEI